MSNKALLQRISRKYAEAIAKSSLNSSMIEELAFLSDTFQQNSEFRAFLEHPSLRAEQKHELLNKAFKGKLSDLTLNTAHLLLDKRRIQALAYLKDAYQEIYNKENNIETAKLSASRTANADELAKIKLELERIFNKDIHIEAELDESLLAGFKIKVAGKVIDASAKSKLKQIKSLLLS